MATLTHFEVATSPATAWVNETKSSVSVATSTSAVITHGDGTITQVQGTGFSQNGNTFTGTVTSAQHTSGNGSVVYENVTGVSTSAQSVLGASTMGSAFSAMLAGTDTLNGWSGDDVLIGYLGNDTIYGGNGSNYLEGREGNDLLVGSTSALGADSSVAAYVNATAGVTITLTGGFNTASSTAVGNASVGTDTLQNIWQVRGSSFGDTFTVLGDFVGPQGTFAAFEGQGGNDTIAGNGNTRIEYTRALAGVTVTFTGVYAGTATSTAGGDAAGIGTDTFTNVNAARGSNFADTLTAAGSGAGGYTFEGRGGNDTIIGETRGINNFDYNIARYDNSTAGVTITLGATSTVTGDASVGTDTLTNVEGYRGSAFADTYTAAAGFSGPFGLYNSFEGLGGNDSVTGNGATRVDYTRAVGAVYVNLQTGTAFSVAAGDAAGIGVDTFHGGINVARGSTFADTIIGSDGAQAERLTGGNGADTIDGGGGLHNGADYEVSPGGVTVDLATGIAVDGYGTLDTLIRIQDVRGSELADIIRGSAADNIISGQAGSDLIVGGAGNDYLRGDDTKVGEPDPYGGLLGTSTPFDSGNDTIFGGAGNDTLSGGNGVDDLHGGRGDDTAYFGFSLASSTVSTSGHVTTVTNSLETATLREVEHLVFTDGTVNLAGTYSPLRTDLNFDHTSDMVLQSGGTVVAWTIADGLYQSGSLITSGAVGFSIVGTGDFNDDGTSDVLLQNGGTVVDWIMKDGAYQSGNVVTSGAAGFAIRATGDYNGDGTTDIVLQNGGTVVLWTMKDGLYRSGSVVTSGAEGFTVVASGDFNGDGTSDILLQNGGTVVEWIMKDGAYLSGSVITSGAAGFTVKGAGDFNGDGTDDVVLQNGGTVVDWLMQDGAYKTGNNLTDGATGFDVRGVGDFNGDGTDDLVLQSGGTVVDWIMKDGLYSTGHIVTDGASGFLIV